MSGLLRTMLFIVAMLFILIVIGVVAALASDTPWIERRPRLAGAALGVFTFLEISLCVPLWALFFPQFVNFGIVFWEVFALVLALILAFAVTSALLSRQH